MRCGKRERERARGPPWTGGVNRVDTKSHRRIGAKATAMNSFDFDPETSPNSYGPSSGTFRMQLVGIFIPKPSIRSGQQTAGKSFVIGPWVPPPRHRWAAPHCPRNRKAGGGHWNIAAARSRVWPKDWKGGRLRQWQRGAEGCGGGSTAPTGRRLMGREGEREGRKRRAGILGIHLGGGGCPAICPEFRNLLGVHT